MLKREQNFIEYIGLLKSFAKRYTVFIAANDTPCGPAFSPAIATELMGIGLKISLASMFRRSYAAIIDAGELVFESIAPSVSESIELSALLEIFPLNSKAFVITYPKKTSLA